MRDRFAQAPPPDVEVADAEAAERPWYARAWSFVFGVVRRIPGWVKDQAIEHPYAAFAAVYGLARAMGVTVQSGNQGLLFSFGRAKEVLEPGFRFLVPFLQVARIVPSRDRTLDLADQRVATLDGLVFRVHATLVWKIVDVRKALIEIGDLEQGMRDSLAISVWEVLYERERAELRVSEEVDRELAEKMARRLEPWGVFVERAGFQSIAPSPRTLALLQLRERVRERERTAGLIAAGTDALPGASGGAALGLVGVPNFPRRRQRRALRRELDLRYRLRAERVHRLALRRRVADGFVAPKELAREKVRVKQKAELAAERGMRWKWSTSAEA